MTSDLVKHGIDPDDVGSNTSNNPTLESLLAARLTRRKTLLGGLAATTAVFTGTGLVGCDSNDDESGDTGTPAATPPLGFTAVPKNLADKVTVPAGYSAYVLFALGDPLVEGVAAYTNDGTQGDFDKRAGDHHDALAYFPFPKGSTSSTEGILAMNHEALTDIYLHAAGPTPDRTGATGPRPLAEVLKDQHAHGVSVIKVKKGATKWAIDKSAALNKRWHINSEMALTGPVAGSVFAVTKLSPNGRTCFGTMNNCGHGVTPWGTFLTGEENWNAYFNRGNDAAQSDAVRTQAFARYAITPNSKGFNYRGWDTPVDGTDLQKRFNVTITGASAAEDFRNEPNHFGYVVELDPYDPTFTPRKRTALGRTSHEGSWFAPVKAGRPVVVYMGDDSRNEYAYKFVSAANWDPADATKGPAMGGKYLDSGVLYAARFKDDGTGEWLALTPDNAALSGKFSGLAEIIVNTRTAADLAGATKMDRPEWGGVNPKTGEFYLTLTNNSSRGTGGPAVDAANPRSYEDPKGAATQRGNVNGHIIRLADSSGDAAATTFTWDVYLFGAQADAPAATVNLSGLTAENDFSSPDGLWFDNRGILWIQTDDGAYTDVTNCMMLAAVPGKVGDGGQKMVGAQKTFAGKAATPDLVRRFLVGTPGCEITGVDMTPDYKTMFVNIQHPGESGTLTTFQSNWPSMTTDDATVTGTAITRPRTATIVITKNDGGPIGV
ncbi:phosphatase [Solimonas fluminis]|jgi:secreted PhoX family phosphatase|uniref:Phosphatase n=1 Tax=Solimonas fluminis TaxID=2086571 RepID=A0A2S5TCR9_9GAMM|nr:MULTISPECIES: PhoX family phosphatase [Solimonas]MDM4771368.1 PhoX family phosphatase [Solimonas sp. SE-A11]PPE72746.1 phosphatase [Solimonas fluminis]